MFQTASSAGLSDPAGQIATYSLPWKSWQRMAGWAMLRYLSTHHLLYVTLDFHMVVFFLSGIVRYDVDNDSKWIHHFIVTRLELQLYGLWMFKFYLNPFKSMWNPCSTPTLLDPNVLLRLGSLPRRWRMWNSLEITMLTKTRCFCHWPVILKGLDVKPEVLL